MTAMLRTFVSTAVVLSCLLAADAPAQKRQKTKTKKAKASEWVAGVAYTTDWKTAIKAVQQSGKMLFIYNGWERKGI
jgi:hypothetical protein